MAGGKDDVKTAQTKRSFDSVPSTPGRKSLSPSKKQAKQSLEDQHGLSSEVFNALNSILDVKLEELTTRLSVMMDTKIAELEKKFKGISKEITKIKDDFNESINYIEDVLKHDIDLTWEYAVRNEQYSRKNNLRILGIDEQEGEDLEGKFISCMRENLREEVKPEEVEIIHRVGPKKFTVGNAGNSTGDQRSARPRPVIVRLLSNKTKTRLLLKRRQLKGKKVVILEDMAQDFAKRLKKLKEKHSVDSAWFTNGKIKYELKDDPRIVELKEWKDL